MRHYGEIFRDIKARYDRQSGRDPELICAAGFHMDCDVLKLRKPFWTNDDPHKINSPTGGIFFSIWITDDTARKCRAEYNIHSYRLGLLKAYRIAGVDFSKQFRIEFAKIRNSWPNVSTDFGPGNLMQGWFKIEQNSFARDALALMNQFEKVATIIDDLLKQRIKLPNPARSRT